MNQAVTGADLFFEAAPQVKGIVVASASLDALFNSERILASDGTQIFGRLHLPEYQRPYRWEAAQLERLLTDLRLFFPEDAGLLAMPTHDFYLGSIILHQQGGSEHRRGQLNIIDGQQRLTSMALLRFLLSPGKSSPDLQFSSPESQKRIRRNLAWLEQRILPQVDFKRVNISLVVTRSEDHAYRFFETQNTSGVPLGGADIIKAYHLRSVPRCSQDNYARAWEALGDLKATVGTLMKSRHWQTLRWRDVASDRDPMAEREEIVLELADRTLADGPDMAYGLARICRGTDGVDQQTLEPGYDLRQPLGAGINAIRYVEHFHSLRDRWLVKRGSPGHETFDHYYKALAVDACGSVFLRRLYDCTLLLYINRFGTSQLPEASLWLFRMTFSLRLINDVSVKEKGAQALAREHPVLDWIASSHTHEQVMDYLRKYDYPLSIEGIGPDRQSIKSRFIKSVARTLSLNLPWDDVTKMPTEYDQQLCEAFERLCGTDGVLGNRR